MKDCTITVSLREKTFVSNFPIKENTPEYVIADEAYRLALIFAKTRAIALYGNYFNSNMFADLMKDLDYTYTVQ